MPTIQLNNFGGIVPRIHPTLLPGNCAIKAHNCKLKNGKLMPLKEPKVVEDDYIRFIGTKEFGIEEAKSVYVWHLSNNKKLILLFKGAVDFAQTNFGSDTNHRIFVSGDTSYGEDGKEAIVIWEEDNEINIQQLRKDDPPKLEITRYGESLDSDDNIRYTYFFQTWVDRLGYESGCSVQSDEVQYYDGDTIKINAWKDDVPDDAISRRIYKVVTGLETNNIQFVREQTKKDGVFYSLSFAIKDEDTGEIMPMITATPHKIQGLTFVAGGFYAGYTMDKPRTIVFSDIGAPTSFPEEYAYDVNEDVVGLATVQNNVFILTKGYPYCISGTLPEAMASTKIPSMQGCISKRGYCVLGGAVYYISQDGICMFADGQGAVDVVTSDYFTKEQWSDIVDENSILIGYDSALYLWTNKVEGIGGYRFEFIDKLSAVTTFDNKAECVCVDAVTDKMFFINKE